MFISVIIPVYNGGDTFKRCLEALDRTLYESWECIVVDDCSTDDSAALAYAHGCRVLTGLQRRVGPAQARNIGAQVAQGDILFFIDADVLVQPGTIGHAAATMQAGPTLAACFGSYDDSPTETNFLSQYRNLLHHYTHQNANVEASTFWSGCGAIRREIFLEAGGFQGYPRPSIEDIELGYRLRAAGHRIRLEKLLLVRHMKRWTPRQMVVTDIRDRALPWTQLIMQAGFAPNDLNLQISQRISTLAAFMGLFGLILLPFSGWGAAPVVAAALLLIGLNSEFYSFLRQKRGLGFSLMAMPWHWLYFVYSGASFVIGQVLYRLVRTEPNMVRRVRPLPPLSLSSSQSHRARVPAE